MSIVVSVIWNFIFCCLLFIAFKFIISNDRMIQRCPWPSNKNCKIKVSKQRECKLYTPIFFTYHISSTYSFLHSFYSIIYPSITIFYISSNYLSNAYSCLCYIYSIISPSSLIYSSSRVFYLHLVLFLLYLCNAER